MTPLNPQGTPSVVERLRAIAASSTYEPGDYPLVSPRILSFIQDAKDAALESAVLILTLQERIETLEAVLEGAAEVLKRIPEDGTVLDQWVVHAEQLARSTLSPEGMQPLATNEGKAS